MIRTQLAQSLKMPFIRSTITRPFLRLLSTKYAHQEQLYLHKLDNTPNAHLVSFSKDPSKIAIGKAFIDSETDEIIPKNFEVNEEFVGLLHSIISKNVGDDFSYLVESTEYTGQSMPIYDLRNVPEYQRIPEVEDLFGFVRCDDKGGVIPDSYESNNLYKVVSVNGPVMLTEHIHDKLLEEIGEAKE